MVFPMSAWTPHITASDFYYCLEHSVCTKIWVFFVTFLIPTNVISPKCISNGVAKLLWIAQFEQISILPAWILYYSFSNKDATEPGSEWHKGKACRSFFLSSFLFFPPCIWKREAARRTWEMVVSWSYLCKERSMLLHAREYHSFWPFCLVPLLVDGFWFRLERFASKHAKCLICWRLRHLLAINIHVSLACDILFETVLLPSRLKLHYLALLPHGSGSYTAT